MSEKDNNHKIFYFSGILAIVFIVSFVVFAITGIAPPPFCINCNQNLVLPENTDIIRTTTTSSRSDEQTRPERISIPSIGVDSHIEQPSSRRVGDLDQFLSRGPVYYPNSGYVEFGNMFIFGHSASAWSYVKDPALTVFNDLEKTEKGDRIEIEADGRTYVYKITKVQLVDENEALVEFDNSKRTITLSTCNTFGKQQERWVVEAEFYREV